MIDKGNTAFMLVCSAMDLVEHGEKGYHELA